MVICYVKQLTRINTHVGVYESVQKYYIRVYACTDRILEGESTYNSKIRNMKLKV